MNLNLLRAIGKGGGFYQNLKGYECSCILFVPIGWGAKVRKFSAKAKKFGAKARMFSAKARMFSAKTRKFGAKARMFSAKAKKFGAKARKFSAKTRKLGSKARMLFIFLKTFTSESSASDSDGDESTSKVGNSLEERIYTPSARSLEGESLTTCFRAKFIVI